MARHLVAETTFLKDPSEIRKEAEELGVDYDAYKEQFIKTTWFNPPILLDEEAQEKSQS